MISSVAAQTNCSVNAGSPELYCQGEKIKLRGAISGQFDVNTVKWELISSPPGSNIQIDDVNAINSKTSIASIPGEYTFSLSLICAIGDAIQTVTHTVNPTAEGHLIFPDLDCFPEIESFWVQKIITPGNYFIYDFELDNKIKIVEQQADSMRLEIRACFTEEFYYPQYRVSNQFGCSLSKIDTMLSIVDYIPSVEIILSDDEACGNLLGYCPSTGQPKWTITSAPAGSIASLSTPNSKNTEVCDLIVGGNYTFQYEVIDAPCTVQPPGIIAGPVDPMPCMSEVIDNNVIYQQFCPGEIPESAVLTFNSIITPEEVINWTQIEGPETTLIGKDKVDLTVTGLQSGFIYTFLFTVYNPINDCTYLNRYILYEETIDPNIEFLIRDESFQFCSTFQSCNNQYIFSDKNQNSYFDVNMNLELISYPPNADISDPFFVQFDTPGNNNVPLAFSTSNRVNSFFFDNLRFSDSTGGQLRFFLCSEMAPGNYSFKLTLENECFEYEETMILRTNSQLNNILPNAGTDQVLPCFQDSTTIVGNEMGWDNNIVYGFWSTIEQPANSDNPIPNLIQDQFLSLYNLSVGQYTFRYFYFYNDLSSNQNLCEYENRYDDVSVIVSENDIENLALISDEVFCISDEYCIQLPIDDGGSSTSIEQTGGPNTSIPSIQSGGFLCFEQLESSEIYSFNYMVDNGCAIYSQEFEIEIADSAISPAVIINEDDCILGNAPETHILMAQDISDGVGEWTYIGVGTAVFTPSASSSSATATIIDGINYPVYREFIWTVTSDVCNNINQDKYIIKSNGFVPIEIEPLYIDCNASFPYELPLNPSEAIEGTQVQWTLLSSSSDELPDILDAQNDSTEIVFNTSGTFIFELKYFFGGDCGESEEVALIEVRLSESDAVSYAGEDLFLCDSQFELAALDPGSMQGFWSILQTEPQDLILEIENVQDFQTSVNFLEQGNATLIWNILANDPNCGVVSQDDVFLSWQEFNLTTTSLALCNESLTVIEHSPINQDNIEWSLIEGPSDEYFIGAIDGSTTLFSNLEEGVYEFQYQYTTQSSDCSTTGTIQIAILGLGEINSEQSYCEVENNTLDELSLDFNISEFVISQVLLQDKPIGSLDGINPILNTGLTSFRYTGFDLPGTYVFQIVGSSGACEVSAFLSILIGDPPVGDLPSNLSFCEGDVAFLNPGADAELFYLWSPANLVSDPSLPNPQFTGTEDAILNVEISSSENFDNCVVNKDISIAFSKIEASITPAQILCELQDLIIEINSADSNLNIEWIDENEEFLGTGTSLSIMPESDMLITALITNADGCEQSLTTTVEISPLINGINANADPSFIDLGESTQLSVANNAAPLDDCLIEWSPAEVLNDANSQNPIATPPSTQIFEVQIEKDDCIARDFIEVEVDNSCLNKEYFIPNMFTPNGDGHNDCFQVYGDMENFKLYIFDRWGEEIIVITETNACWDGSYNSQDLPPDVYAYYVKHMRCDGVEIEFKGNVTLIK